MFKEVATVDIQPIRDLLETIPLPSDTWALTGRQKQTALTQTRSITLRQHDDKGYRELHECYDTEYRNQYPRVEPFVELVKGLGYGEDVGRIVIASMPARTVVLPHHDRGIYLRTYTRFVIPLLTNSKVVYTVAREDYYPEVTKVYLFDNQKQHSVVNDGDTDRIFLIIDVKQ